MESKSCLCIGTRKRLQMQMKNLFHDYLVLFSRLEIDFMIYIVTFDLRKEVCLLKSGWRYLCRVIEFQLTRAEISVATWFRL